MPEITAELARSLLPPRPDDAHKNTFGRVLVVAGSLQYPGAACLATGGAARVGAGVVTLATGRSAINGPGRFPEITLEIVTEAEWGYLGTVAADELIRRFVDYRALLVGPGIGRDESTRNFLTHLLHLDEVQQRGSIGFQVGAGTGKPTNHLPPPPTVLDADALTLLAQVEQWWERLPRESCILTPHPGEMRRLLDGKELGSDHERIAREAAQRWGQVVVLKGGTATVIAAPDDRCQLHPAGNPALATAGTGDVLAGAIAGLLAQGCDLFAAAVLGTYLHSAAGRLLRRDLGIMGTLASDLLGRLPLAIKGLRG